MYMVMCVCVYAFVGVCACVCMSAFIRSESALCNESMHAKMPRRCFDDYNDSQPNCYARARAYTRTEATKHSMHRPSTHVGRIAEVVAEVKLFHPEQPLR